MLLVFLPLSGKTPLGTLQKLPPFTTVISTTSTRSWFLSETVETCELSESTVTWLLCVAAKRIVLGDTKYFQAGKVLPQYEKHMTHGMLMTQYFCSCTP